jgi:hypothetical protein
MIGSCGASDEEIRPFLFQPQAVTFVRGVGKGFETRGRPRNPDSVNEPLGVLLAKKQSGHGLNTDEHGKSWGFRGKTWEFRFLNPRLFSV